MTYRFISLVKKYLLPAVLATALLATGAIAQESKSLLNTMQKVDDILINSKPVFASHPESPASGRYWYFYLRHNGFFYNISGKPSTMSSCIKLCREELEETCTDCSTGKCCMTCPSTQDELTLKKLTATELQQIKSKKTANTIGNESKDSSATTGSFGLELKTTLGLPWMNLDVKTLATIQEAYAGELKTSSSSLFEDSTQETEKQSGGDEAISKFSFAHHYSAVCTKTDILAGAAFCEVYALCDIIGDQAIQNDNGQWYSAGKDKIVFASNIKIFVTVVPAGAGILDVIENSNCKCRNCPNKPKDDSKSTASGADSSSALSAPKLPVSKAPVASSEPPKPEDPKPEEPPKPEVLPGKKPAKPANVKIPPMTSFAQVNVKKGDKSTFKDPYGKGAEITNLDTGEVTKIPPNGSVTTEDFGKGFLYSSPSLFGPIAIVKQPDSTPKSGTPSVKPPAGGGAPKGETPEIDTIDLGGTPTKQVPVFGNGSTPPMTVTGNWPEESDFNLTGNGKDGETQTYDGNQIVDIQTGEGSQGVVKFDDLPTGNPGGLANPSLSVTTPEGVESPGYQVNVFDGKINSKVVPENAPPNSTADLVIEYKTLLPVLKQSVLDFSTNDYIFEITYPANITGPETAHLNQSGVTTAAISIGQTPGTYDIYVTLMPKDMLK